MSLLSRGFSLYSVFFFFNDTATTEIYTLSLHDALPILAAGDLERELAESAPALEDLEAARHAGQAQAPPHEVGMTRDRKSTRLNSSHLVISYAVFCLKKKKTRENERQLSAVYELGTT